MDKVGGKNTSENPGIVLSTQPRVLQSDKRLLVTGSRVLFALIFPSVWCRGIFSFKRLTGP